MKEFTSAVQAIEGEDAGEEQYVEFKIDNRVLRAYPPNDGQLAFMLAALGRGQTKDSRTAGVINVMMSSLRDDDQDWFESRLLDSDPKTRIGVGTITEVFEYLVGEWFARPTQSPSDSADSPPSDGQKSKPRTTKSNS